MTTKLFGKGITFLGAVICLNVLQGQNIQLEAIPASGPKAFDGQLKLLTDLDIPPDGYLWQGPNGCRAQTAEISGLGVGTYCVTITEANSKQQTLCKYLGYQCPDPGFGIQIQQPTPGAANGKLTLHLPLEGEMPYLCQWNTSDTGKIISNLLAGFYQLTITDTNNCAYYPGIQLFEMKTEDAKLENLFSKCSGSDSSQAMILEVRPATSFGAVRELAVTALYPNPNQIFLEIYSWYNAWVSITIHDCYQRLVFKDLRFAREGNNRFVLPCLQQLPQGLFIIGITNCHGRANYKKLLHMPQ